MRYYEAMPNGRDESQVVLRERVNPAQPAHTIRAVSPSLPNIDAVIAAERLNLWWERQGNLIA